MKSNRLFAVRQQAYELKQAQENQRFIQAETKMRKALQGENVVFNWDMILQFSECFAVSGMSNPEFYAKSPSRETAFIPPAMTYSRKMNWMLLGATLFLILQNTHAAGLDSKIEIEIPMEPMGQAETKVATRSLPPECENYKVVKGNPYTAKTLLFGQKNGLCDEAGFQCMKALSKGKSKKATTLLVEGVTAGQHIPCDVSLGSTAGNKNWSEFTDTCQGWSPENDNDTRKHGKSEKLQEAVTLISKSFKLYEIHSFPVYYQSSTAQEIIEGTKVGFKARIEFQKRDHQKIYETYKKNHPDVKYENFHTIHLEMIKDLEYSIKILDKITAKIVLGMSANQITELFNEEISRHNNELERLHKAPDHLKPGGNYDAQKQNKYLAKSVRDASKQHEKVFVLAGDPLVNPNPVLENQYLHHRVQPSNRPKMKASFDTYRQAALDLYKDLDQFADENPYAVLSCTLEPEWDNNKKFRS